MSRLPTVGGDDNDWGTILNDYLSVEHNSDGSQKTLDLTKGGTGATDAAAALTNLGAVSTTDSRLSDTRTPTDGSVTTAKIADGAVSSAKVDTSIVTSTGAASGKVPVADGSNGYSWGTIAGYDGPGSDVFVLWDSPYNAKGDGAIVNDASITSGSTALHSSAAAFTSADVGKYVLVRGAGLSANQNNLVATIQSVASGVATLSVAASATVTNASLLYGTDDTAAIQKAIDACYPDGGTIYGGDRIYIVAGSLKTVATAGDNAGAHTYCSQLTLPDVSLVKSKVVVRFLGKLPMSNREQPDTTPYLSGFYPGKGFTIASILVGQTYTTAGWPSLLAGPDLRVNGATTWTNVRFISQNCRWLCPENPSISALHLANVASHDMIYSAIKGFTPFNNADRVQPTNSWAHALFAPVWLNNAPHNYDGLIVEDFYSGIDLCELVQARNVIIRCCYLGLGLYPSARPLHVPKGHFIISRCPNFLAYADPSTGITNGSTDGPLDLELDIESQKSGSATPTWATRQVLVNVKGTGRVRVMDQSNSSDTYNWNLNSPSAVPRTTSSYDVDVIAAGMTIYKFLAAGTTGDGYAPALPTGWSQPTGFQGAFYWVDDSGAIRLGGCVQNTSGATKAAGSTVVNVPPYLQPNNTVYMMGLLFDSSGPSSANAPTLMPLQTSGQSIKVMQAVPASYYVLLTGASFKRTLV